LNNHKNVKGISSANRPENRTSIATVRGPIHGTP
jgi:hypothetical protein